MNRRDPGLTADERPMLEEFLDYHRATMLRKVEGLTDDQLAMTTAASDLTLGGLLKHLALVEDHWFREVLLDVAPAPLWQGVDWEADRDWEFHSARDDTGPELVALYREACAASREAAASVESLDALSLCTTKRNGARFSLRWIFLHMIEETARHNGHADFLRQSIDGTTGD